MINNQQYNRAYLLYSQETWYVSVCLFVCVCVCTCVRACVAIGSDGGDDWIDQVH